ncbi:helix-turn-helix transcriptional regulator [bacterium]|nr:helix-turn-helix transcriptional regulator [bacterium]
MQEENSNFNMFRVKMGGVVRKLRIERGFLSLNKFALEYDINRANLSKIERGEVGCSLAMAWKISEALGLKFSEFVKILEKELGDKFTFIDA